MKNEIQNNNNIDNNGEDNYKNYNQKGKGGKKDCILF